MQRQGQVKGLSYRCVCDIVVSGTSVSNCTYYFIGALAYVGPMPPEVTTKSYFDDMRRAASIISASSSAITSMRLRLMPNEKQNFAKYAEWCPPVCDSNPGSASSQSNGKASLGVATLFMAPDLPSNAVGDAL